jgi:hypothetical protein
LKPAKNSLQCNLNNIASSGFTANIEARFVLRRQDSICLQRPKCGREEKGFGRTLWGCWIYYVCLNQLIWNMFCGNVGAV